eukprot:g3033.t1
MSLLFVFFVVFSALGIVVIMTFATVKDGGEASAVDVVILKIAWNSAIISAGAASFPLSWPPAVVSMFQFYAVASASAMGDSLSADCVVRTGSLRPVQAWAMSMAVIAPVTVTLWIVLYSTLGRCRCKNKYMSVHLPVATLVTLLMGHPVITKAALKLLACRPVADRYFLESDFNVSCDSEEYYHWGFILALPMVLVFTFGVPTAYALAMYWHVRKGRLAEKRAVYGFLFSGFVKNRWWFELWNTLRKSFFTMGAVLFGPYGTSLQTWAALVLLLLFLAVFSLSNPYGQQYLNRLERAALSINVLTLLFGTGLYLNEQAGESRSQVFAVTLTVLILLLNAYFLLNVSLTLWKYGSICSRCCCHKPEEELPRRHSGPGLRPGMGHRLSLGNDTIRKLVMKEVTSVKSHRLIDEAALRKKARLKRLDTDRLSAQQRLHQRLGKRQEKHQVKLMAVGTVRKSDAKTPTEANVGSAVISVIMSAISAAAPPASTKVNPLAVIDASIGQRIHIVMKGDKELVGTLQGFDNYVNMVLEDVTEWSAPALEMWYESDCRTLVSALQKYGDAYHRPGEVLCTSRRVIVPSHRLAFERIVNRTSAIILRAIGDSQYVIDEAAIVQTAPTGQPKHSDATQPHPDAPNTWIPNHTPHRIWSASIGCSKQGSYEGGRLQFWTDRNIEDVSFKLWVGDAVAFTSAEENVHSVEAVSAGTRYQLLIWYTLPGGSPRHPDEAFVERWLVSLDASADGLSRSGKRFSRLTRFKTELATHGLAYLVRHRIHGSQARADASQKGVAWIDEQSLKRIGLSKIETRLLIQELDAAKWRGHGEL